jgi:hypothetical protein
MSSVAQKYGMWNATVEVGLGAGGRAWQVTWRLAGWCRVKRIRPIWDVCFVLLAASAALCQSLPSSLPDSPSVQAIAQTPKFNGFFKEAQSPLTFEALGSREGGMWRGEFSAAERTAPGRISSQSQNIFSRYLRSQSVRQDSRSALSDGSLMGRATYAASRTVVSRDASGKGRLNTSYLLRVLTSVAKDEASTPYWRRHRADPFSDFGSTVGNDAGLNVLHEFAPALQQAMKSHAPRFAAQIAERIARR